MKNKINKLKLNNKYKRIIRKIQTLLKIYIFNIVIRILRFNKTNYFLSNICIH